MATIKRLILGALILISVVFWGCTEEPIVEVPITEEPAQISLSVLDEVISTFDIISDLATSSDLFMKKDESLLPNGVAISFLDSSFVDGTGITVILDFGPLGDEPSGLLCKDNKYRAGKMVLELDRPYMEIGAKLKVSFAEIEPYYSGNGTEMTELVGDMNLTRISIEQVDLHCSKVRCTLGEDVQVVESNLAITTLEDDGIGIVNDELSFSGDLKVTNNTSEILLTTLYPMHKNYTLDCAKHIVSGLLNIDVSDNLSTMEVDFDPDNNQACDNKVALTVNGKRLIYHY